MKRKRLILSVMLFSTLWGLIPGVTANAQAWREKYANSNKYKVRVLKTTRVYKLKYGDCEANNRYVGTRKLHKGSI
ncbi:MAG TPA: hypothetical protein H9875_06320, partial [Candidatus Levilactobacillus faecigallinarum]|nr:hypothetical protein [Candidatus Levilactobacillus faecigallinarum]